MIVAGNLQVIGGSLHLDNLNILIDQNTPLNGPEMLLVRLLKELAEQWRDNREGQVQFTTVIIDKTYIGRL